MDGACCVHSDMFCIYLLRKKLVDARRISELAHAACMASLPVKLLQYFGGYLIDR